MKLKTPQMWWRKERDQLGTTEALLNRIQFHKTVDLEEAARLMGLSINTIRRHAQRLIDSGEAILRHTENHEYLSLK